MMGLPSINKLNHRIKPQSTAEQASFDEHVLMSMWGATGVVIIWEGSKIIQSVSPMRDTMIGPEKILKRFQKDG